MLMSEYRAAVTDDVARATEATTAFLCTDPVQHNLILTLLEQRQVRPEPGQYGWVTHDGDVVGVSFRSPLIFHAAVTPMPADAVEVLASELASVDPALPGVAGDAATAARFAGRWAELLKVPAAPAEGQRLYELRSLRPPTGVDGHARVAVAADLDRIIEWAAGFEQDTGSHVPSPDMLAQRVTDGLIWLWEHGEPVSMAGYTRAIGGVSRIGHVYTPPDQRGRGYAAACTAATSQVAFDAGADRCVLYTQLENPVSNAIYRRLGYEPVGEQLRYAFTLSVATEPSGASSRSDP